METRVDEIADNIFRIAVWTDRAPITFNQFVIRDDCPALIHTGHAALFVMCSIAMVSTVAIQNQIAAYMAFSRRRARVPNTLTA